MSTFNRARDRGADGRILPGRRRSYVRWCCGPKGDRKLRLVRSLRQRNKAACRACFQSMEVEQVAFTDHIRLPVWFW